MALPNFEALRDLHTSANNLLQSPIIQKSLSQQEKFVHEISETSFQMLDKCGTTKDILLLVKNYLKELQSAFRRISGGKTTIEGKFEAFHLHRKKLKKEILKRMHSLKGMKNSRERRLSLMDKNLMVIVNVFREVRETTLCIMESLMSLMAMPNNPGRRSNKGYLGLKLKRENSLILGGNSCDHSTMLQIASKRLEAVEIVIEDIEDELECMFRRLIQTRVSLLNILTN